MQLLKLRTEKKMSQEFIARQLNVSRNTVKNWEDGVTEPTASLAIKLADILDTNVENLMK